MPWKIADRRERKKAATERKCTNQQWNEREREREAEKAKPIHGSNNIINTPHRIIIKNPKIRRSIYRLRKSGNGTAHARYFSNRKDDWYRPIFFFSPFIRQIAIGGVEFCCVRFLISRIHFCFSLKKIHTHKVSLKQLLNIYTFWSGVVFFSRFSHCFCFFIFVAAPNCFVLMSHFPLIGSHRKLISISNM